MGLDANLYMKVEVSIRLDKIIVLILYSINLITILTDSTLLSI